MNKLYNFEPIFEIFLKSRNIPSQQKKSSLVFFRSFLNWIAFKLKLDIKNDTADGLLPYLTKDSQQKYEKFLSLTKIPKTTIKLRLDILSDFRNFLEKHPSLPIKTAIDEERLATIGLIEEFLSELEDHGGGRNTIRNYRTDLYQFFNFLYKNGPA